MALTGLHRCSKGLKTKKKKKSNDHFRMIMGGGSFREKSPYTHVRVHPTFAYNAIRNINIKRGHQRRWNRRVRINYANKTCARTFARGGGGHRYDNKIWFNNTSVLFRFADCNFIYEPEAEKSDFDNNRILSYKMYTHIIYVLLLLITMTARVS